MITKYISEAMKKAHYELIENKEFYGEIPVCKGVWATAYTLEECREKLQEVLEDWIVLKLQDKDSLPIIEGIELTSKAA
jgi:predicted RNase H-like HicB family nuclease